jgi:hypothetical protein
MLQAQQVNLCLMRLNTVFGCISLEELATKHLVILVGDRYQLPPVCYHQAKRGADDDPTAELCKKCHIAFGDFWKMCDHFELQNVHRFVQDSAWLQFLGLIRKTKPTQQQIDDVMGHLFCTEAEALDWVDDTCTVITSHHAEREVWSERLYERAVASGEADAPRPVLLHTNGPLPDTDDMKKWAQNSKFHRLTKVSKGTRVVVFAGNLDPAKGIVNSATGVVQEVHGSTDADVKHITVRMDETGATYKFSKSHKGSKWCQTGANPKVHTKNTFPLMLAYAITGHASQGSTMRGRVLIHVTDAFAAGLLYVMLSRVARRALEDGTLLLRVVGRLTPEHFTPMQFPD